MTSPERAVRETVDHREPPAPPVQQLPAGVKGALLALGVLFILVLGAVTVLTFCGRP